MKRSFGSVLSVAMLLISLVGAGPAANATTLQVQSATLGPDGRTLSLTFNHPVEVAGNCCIGNLISIRSDGTLLGKSLTISGSTISGLTTLSGAPIEPGAVVTLDIYWSATMQLQKVGDPTVYWNSSTVSVTNNSVRLALTGETQVAISGQNDLSATHPTYSNYAGNTNFDYYSCVSDPVINSDNAKSAYVPYVNGSMDWIISGADDPTGPGVTIGSASDCYHLNTQYSVRLSNTAQWQSVLVGNQLYDPTAHGQYILAASRTFIVGSTHYFLRFSAAQLYTPPVTPAVVMPVFTIASNGLITIQTMPSWTGQNAGSEEFVIKAFLPSESAVTTPVTGQALSTLGSSGNSLFDSSSTSNNLITPTTLVGAKVYDGSTFTDYDPAIHGREIVIQAYANYGLSTYGVSTASQTFSGSLSGAQPQVVAAPYTGPVLQTPGAVAPVARGSKVVIPGSNLSGVSKVEIGGVDAKVVVNSSGELEITVPSGLAAGTYDLVVTSDSGKLTVQDGIRVSGSATSAAESVVRPGVKKDAESNTVKVRVFDVIGAGKVQILVNGKEIAWINAVDANDPKLFGEYLVRTIELKSGKNAIEVFVNGVRSDRWAFTG